MSILTSGRNFARTYFAVGAAICMLAAYQTEQQTEALLKLKTRYKWALLIILFVLNAAWGLYIALRGEDWVAPWVRLRLPTMESIIARIGGLILVIVPLAILWSARADFFGRGLEAFFRLLWLFWWLALLQAAGLKLATRFALPTAFAFTLLTDGALAELFTLGLPVSNYPFSMGWSEASRFYYGSLPLSGSIYGARAPLSVLHGSRYLLLAIPFVIKNLPIWAARLWQQLLWLGTAAATSWSLVHRLRQQESKIRLVLGTWFFLYLFQGAVYYHLLVCVILILLGVSREHPWRSSISVVAASFWAGMSRLNWYPVPAMLAIALYLMERPASRAGGLWRYVKTPVWWGVVGLAAALAGQAFYVAISGNTNLEAFGSSLTSALLWYRWFPSATNPIGIIPGVLIVSSPLWFLLAWILRGQLSQLHPVRWLGLAGMLLILLVGGLVVSTKIGGGGDLHNMDAYIVLLGLAGAYLICGQVAIESQPEGALISAPYSLILWMLFVPVAFSILRIGSPYSYDAAKTAADVSSLGREVEAYGKSGEVLFMYERQLLTFGLVPRVPLVADYEVVTLMEMAISGNRPYLQQFYSDLASHRFSAIVAHPQNLGVETGDFIEESNAWNRFVGQPLLCQYKPALTLDYSNVQVLVPRARPCPDFPPALAAP